jgi:hypothetical protein
MSIKYIYTLNTHKPTHKPKCLSWERLSPKEAQMMDLDYKTCPGCKNYSYFPYFRHEPIEGDYCCPKCEEDVDIVYLCKICKGNNSRKR